MNMSRIALLSISLGYSTSLYAVPVVWDFLLKDVASRTYKGSFGYESDQVGEQLPRFVDPELPTVVFPLLPTFVYDVDFFWIEDFRGARASFTDGIALELSNDVFSEGGTMDAIALRGLFDVRPNSPMLNLATVWEGNGTQNPLISTHLQLPTDNSDFDFFNPWFDVADLNRFRHTITRFASTTTELVSLEIHRVPEPPPSMCLVLLPLILRPRVRNIRRMVPVASIRQYSPVRNGRSLAR